jgi:hypothetical protein
VFPLGVQSFPRVAVHFLGRARPEEQGGAFAKYAEIL